MPIQLFKQAERPLNEAPALALAILPPAPEHPFVHVAFVYRDEAEQLWLSHLAFHFDFRGKQEPGEDYWWLESQLNSEVQDQVATYLELVASNNPADEIRYSILDAGNFDRTTGKFLDAGVGKGFTCSTYVVSILRTLDVALLDASTWPPPREQDIKWAELILEAIEQKFGDRPETAEHVQVQRDHIRESARFRPEEVAAAFALFDYVPLTFAQVEPTSREILDAVGHPLL